MVDDCNLQAMSRYGKVKNLRIVRDIGKITFTFLAYSCSV